jgi:hypothetical protein
MIHANSMKEIMDKDLLRVVRKPLKFQRSSKDQQSGYVYIISRSPDMNCFKIGFSTSDPHGRLSRHRKCHSGAALVMSTPRIRHAYRIELLAQWDLNAYRLKQFCIGCAVYHREWFSVSKDRALQAVATWAFWMRYRPYKRVLGRLKGDWQGKLRLARRDWAGTRRSSDIETDLELKLLRPILVPQVYTTRPDRQLVARHRMPNLVTDEEPILRERV